jgi:hypothetical protein
MIMQIEIPLAEYSHEIASKEAHRKAVLRAAEEEKREKELAETMARSWEMEVPALIQTITDKIVKRSNEGYSRYEFSIRDNQLSCTADHRIDYYFNGLLTNEMIEVIEKTFSMAGYKISGYNIRVNWNSYRTATFDISW